MNKDIKEFLSELYSAMERWHNYELDKIKYNSSEELKNEMFNKINEIKAYLYTQYLKDKNKKESKTEDI